MNARHILILTLITLALTSIITPAIIPVNTAQRPLNEQSLSLPDYVPPNETECDIIVPDNYPSINMSVTAAQPGQTICVRPGEYAEVYGTIINKNGLRLLALGRPEIPNESVVIKRSGFLLRIQASNVVVKGFIIVQEGSWHGIDIYTNSQNVTIAHNIVTTTNTSLAGYYGIRVYRSSNTIITYNKIYGWLNSYGIFINEASNNTVANNTIYNNNNGVRIRGTSIPAKYNKIFLNTIVNNTYGIYFYIASGGILSDNEIYLNTFSNTNNYCIYGTSGPNRWYSPIEYTYMYGGQYFTSYMGNYWSTYNGSDSDNNGIGDAPYVIDPNNVDRYPLMRPHQEYLIGVETSTPTPTETTTTETTTTEITPTSTETTPIITKTQTITITTTQTATYTYTYTMPIQTQTVTTAVTETITKTATTTKIESATPVTLTATEKRVSTVKLTETSTVEVPVINYNVTVATGIMLLLVGFLAGFVLRRK